jgi:ribosomal-protein-serine acetyltransferase
LTEFPPQLGAIGLRPLTEADAPELQALIEANRDYLARWFPWVATQGSADTEKFIAESHDQLARNDGFQVCIASDGSILGIVGFHSVDWTNRNTTIGYWLAEDAQGRGIMTAVVRALVDHAFGEWNLHRIVYGLLEGEAPA